MKIKTRKGEITLSLYGFATEKIYENRNNKALDLSEPKATTMIELFYCVTAANMQRLKMDVIGFDDWFDDIYDLNEGDKTIYEFFVWYVEQKNAQAETLSNIVNKKKKTK